MSFSAAMKHSFSALLVSGITLVHSAALAGGDQPTADSKTTASKNESMEMDYQKSMKMDEPMPTGMAKPGMKKGDVRVNAGRKETEMEKMMQEEMK